MTFSNRTYNALKWIVTVVLPAFATLYLTMSTTWGLPEGEKVAATATALATFLGVLIGISSKNYANRQVDGDLMIGNEGVYAAFAKHPSTYTDKDRVTLRPKRLSE